VRIENLPLRCSCGSEYMRHQLVDVFVRDVEDGPVNCVGVSGKTVEFYTGAVDCPSARRDAVVVTVHCEQCELVWDLQVIQHKGQTLLTFKLCE